LALTRRPKRPLHPRLLRRAFAALLAVQQARLPARSALLAFAAQPPFGLEGRTPTGPGKFQNAIADIRGKMALQNAETIARIKQIDDGLHAKLDAAMVDIRARITEGFSQFEQVLCQQAQQNQANLDAALEQLVQMEQEQQQWRAVVDAKLSRLDDVEARLGCLEDRPPAA